jgi:hypothetical protein
MAEACVRHEAGLFPGVKSLNRTESVGIDRISLKDYEKNLNDNVKDLLNRMKKMSYRPQAD